MESATGASGQGVKSECWVYSQTKLSNTDKGSNPCLHFSVQHTIKLVLSFTAISNTTSHLDAQKLKHSRHCFKSCVCLGCPLILKATPKVQISFYFKATLVSQSSCPQLPSSLVQGMVPWDHSNCHVHLPRGHREGRTLARSRKTPHLQGCR